MANARAPGVDTTAAIVDVLVKRDGGSCFWCPSKVVDGEKVTVIHKIPPKAQEPVGVDGLALVCASCNATQKRNIRFPVGLLLAAKEVDMPFSELVRQSVSQYICNLREAPPQYVEEDVYERFKSLYDLQHLHDVDIDSLRRLTAAANFNYARVLNEQRGAEIDPR